MIDTYLVEGDLIFPALDRVAICDSPLTSNDLIISPQFPDINLSVNQLFDYGN
ncbi:hypothetical protein IQ219_15070 [Synechocystis sp. LEGE 06083]|uniref:hypothetical protein n=1 Tax=Synechocystis sp. LEGE 06083 TaxID=915336 RepID=UPI0018823AB5|nr:hypothetical protein [Synechocystis sp. LEGE 06083]MBE9196596.1 hypothetical protein [Synechocystis sp. LEGE 06083]